MAKRVNWAVDGIIKLAENAESESVRLAALRAVFSNMMAVSEFAGLEHRMAQIEEQLHDGTGNTDSHGLRPALGTVQAEVTDRSPWDWYAESCPCGLPPGECRAHPRAGPPSGPPRATGESGRTWPDAGRARRGPGHAGFSTASMTAP